MKETSGGWLTVILGLILCVIRFAIEGKELITTQIVAGLNIIAFNFVIWTIIHAVSKQMNCQLNSGMKKIGMNKIKHFNKIKFGIGIVSCVLSVVYVREFYQGVWNDILAIITLCISIEDNYIKEKIYELYHKCP